MARRRFFVDRVLAGRATLAGEEALHLRRSLRAEAGQLYELSDNQSVYLAEIESVGRDGVEFRVVEELAAPIPPVRLTLLMALVKFDRFEWALEKATELGVERIVPVVSERSEKGLEKAAAHRIERWRKIVRESSQQARRVRLPEVVAPLPLEKAAATAGPLAYFLNEEPGGCPLLAVLPPQKRHSDQVQLLVGPEGGWTVAERACVCAAGWKAVWLGCNILRAETAALAALAAISAAWLAGGEGGPFVGVVATK
jgi:16S rRNA (uracil1498-N3)-methyltransferase